MRHDNGRIGAYASRLAWNQIPCLAALILSGGCWDGPSATDPDDPAVERPPPLLPSPAGGLASFPGAEGWGAEALNACRSLPGELKVVTSLNDSGAGSLREALTSARDDRYTIVVFRTGGTITLTSALFLKARCVYLAGQTAPGGGILLKQTANAPAMSVRDSMIAIRYIRARHAGCTSAADCIAKAGTGSGNFSNARNSGAFVGHIIYDHVSAAWTNDENIALWTAGVSPSDELSHVTVQRSILGEGLKTHSAGGIFGGTNSKDGHRFVYEMSWHHNYFTTNSSRNPSGSGGNAQVSTTRGVEIVNNLVYAWSASISKHAKNSVIDWVNNHWRKFGVCPNNVKIRHEVYPNDPSYYISGNIADGVCTMPSDQWNWLREDSRPYGGLPTAWQRLTRLDQPMWPISVQSASQVWGDVLGDVGANKRLDCSGGWVAASDAVDSRLINKALSGTSDPIPELPGPFPSIARGTPCADADGDGMPDQWEGLHGLDPNDPAVLEQARTAPHDS